MFESIKYDIESIVMRLVLKISAIVIGLVFILSGTGKAFVKDEFIWMLVNSFWTPSIASFISETLPWIEITLGLFLVLGIFSRLASIFVLSLTIGFMANNIWEILNGFHIFTRCSSCFGIWETYLGSLSPMSALVIDIMIFILAINIVIFYPNSFLYWRPFFMKIKSECMKISSTKIS